MVGKNRESNDLENLVGYKVTFYPKEHETYALEAYFLWDWDEPLREHGFGYIVINRVLDVKKVGRDGLILFENGDALPVPFKDYEKPHFRASNRLHGEDTYREGYAIDFEGRLKEMREKFIGEYVVYNTKLASIDVGGNLWNFEIYRESAHKEYAEKDKFSFRPEFGVIRTYTTWGSCSISIYLEDGRIMVFRISDYIRHIDGECKNNIINQLEKDLKTEIGKSYEFIVISGGDKDERHNYLDIVSLKRMDDGEYLPKIKAAPSMRLYKSSLPKK